MTKSDLKNGMFGIFEDEPDDVFVIAGKYIVYQSGLCDDVSDINANLEMPSGRKIAVLYDAHSYNQVKRGDGKVIWKRGEDHKLNDKANDSITITADEFLEAVKKANDKFMGVAKDTPGNPLIDVVMGMQNLAFGALVGEVLFGKEDE